eukprot:14682475-Alexandrium_andersonii.AAC.1
MHALPTAWAWAKASVLGTKPCRASGCLARMATPALGLPPTSAAGDMRMAKPALRRVSLAVSAVRDPTACSCTMQKLGAISLSTGTLLMSAVMFTDMIDLHAS